MIILSGILVVLAIALLVAGIVAGADGVGGVQGLTLIYVSIAISIVSALCLAIGVFLRRRELFGAAGQVPVRAVKSGKPGKAARQAKGAKGAKEAVGQVPDESAEEMVTLPSQPLDVPADAEVFVVRGRKRYHLENCRQLTGRDTEDLTYIEALEEGFSPCTACMPDTALAARAAMSSSEPSLRQPTRDTSSTGRAGGLSRGTRTESTAAGLATASSRPSTPSRPASDDPFGADRSASGGFGASDWESHPDTSPLKRPLSARSAQAPPAEPVTEIPAQPDSAVPPADSPAQRESGRELGTPSWVQSPSTVRSETGRPKRLPSPPVDEADTADTADIGAVVPDGSSQGGSAPDITSRDITSRGSSFQDPASRDGSSQDDSSSDVDGSEAIPQSSWMTTPATPSALDVPADSAAPPVKLKFTGTKPERTQTADADAKPVETSSVVPEAREADPVEDLELKSPSPSSGLLADDPAEITHAEEIIGSTPPEIGLADDAAADDDADAEVVNADDADADVVNADVVNEAAADDTGRPASPQVRILSGTKRYHRPDCALIEDIGDEAEDLESVTRDEAKERGCTPCLVCQPDKEHTAD